MITNAGRRIAGVEALLPAACGLAWWLVFYPGFFGEDSLMNLHEARDGPHTVWFTAWWIYLVDFFTIGTRAIPVLTLAGVLTLEYATYLWLTTCLPPGPARAITTLTISASPLVGAMGIQLRHDLAMTGGLLICAAVVTRASTHGGRWRTADYGLLALAAPLVATRHNGMPTLIGAAVLWLLVRGFKQWQPASAMLAVAAGAATITMAATKASGHQDAVDPIQSIEWLMNDVSCLLTKEGVDLSPGEWATLGTIASQADWRQPQACRFMNPMYVSKSYQADGVRANTGAVVGVWVAMARRHPAQMTAVHLTRVRSFLPPFMTGLPTDDQTPFLHSTILENDFGLAWLFPAIAERARAVVRAWNAMRLLLANLAIWLIVLVVVAWRREAIGARLAPTITIAVTLELGLLVTAPISEGRYGLFILICGQAVALFLLLNRTAPSSPESADRPGATTPPR